MKYKCPKCGTENVQLDSHETVWVSYLGAIDDGVAHVEYSDTDSDDTLSTHWECVNGHEFDPFDIYEDFQVEYE